jgi:hypothetical protein
VGVGVIMRYLTRDRVRKMQFFGIAFEDMDLESLKKEWGNCEYPLDVYEVFYREVEEHKEDMTKLLPESLKNKIFNEKGDVRKDSLNEGLYKELVVYNQEAKTEWEKACRAVHDEEKRIRRNLSEPIKKLIKLNMHDEKAASISLEGEKLIIELENHSWGKPLLIFKGVGKPHILIEAYPAWWLYNELFKLDNGKYEYNILFEQGEASIVFEDFEIQAKTKQFLSGIIDDFSPEAFFREVSNCIGEKERFAGRNSLSKLEKEIALLNEFLTSLIYDSISPKFGFEEGGFKVIEAFPKYKLDKIIDLLSITGPKYLHRITMEAKVVFEETCSREKSDKIIGLDDRIKRRYRTKQGKTGEIFAAFTDYIKAYRDKF